MTNPIKRICILSHMVTVVIYPKGAFHLEGFSGEEVTPKSVGLTNENMGMGWLRSLVSNHENYANNEVTAFNG